MKIGILGGSFNPIHIGHLILAEEVYHRLSLSKVLFIPVHIQPHKVGSSLADAEHRYEMVKLATDENEHFEVSNAEVRRGGISYSIDTLRLLRSKYGVSTEFYFLIGADSVGELPAWKDIEHLANMCRFCVVARPGYDLGDMDELVALLGRDKVREMKDLRVEIPLIGVSSTEIRRRLKENRSIRYLVPPSVERYLLERELYRECS